MENELSELEKRVQSAESLGLAWAEMHEKWLMLDRDEKPYLAALMNDLKGDISEAARERLAKGSKEFREYVVGLALAKGEELRAKVKYENAIAWMEACRTAEATNRMKMSVLREIP